MYNYEEQNEMVDDTIVLNLKSKLDHFLTTVGRNALALILVIALVTELVLCVTAALYKPNYTGNVTYVVSKTGDDGSDANVAFSLAMLATEGFDSTGLHRQLDKRFAEKPEWLYGGIITASADQVTNILILTVTTDNYYHTADLLKVLEEEFPTYAGYMEGTIRLSVLDETEPATDPVNPYSFALMAVVGVLAGLLTAMVIAFVLMSRHQTVREEEDIQSFSSLECLETLPEVRIRGKKKGTVINTLSGGSRLESFSESMRSVRHKVERMMGETEGKVLMVASSISGEGKSTVCTNLALSLAQSGKKVLLIDCDVRNPNVAKVLKIGDIPGTLGGYLMGRVGKDRLITRLQNPKLDVIAGMPGEDVDPSRLRGKRMFDMIMALRQYYDYILLDSAPLTVVSDGTALGQYSDAALFVVRYDYGKKKSVEEGLRTLNSCKVPCIGYVLNGVEHVIHTSDKHSYKSYSYRYGKK